jgi:hypothetical protein
MATTQARAASVTSERSTGLPVSSFLTAFYRADLQPPDTWVCNACAHPVQPTTATGMVCQACGHAQARMVRAERPMAYRPL